MKNNTNIITLNLKDWINMPIIVYVYTLYMWNL